MNGAASFWLTRMIFQRGMALVYLIAFLTALNQFRPLLGEHGLLPAAAFIKEVPFFESPSIFYAFPQDTAFSVAAWMGVLLSCFAMAGFSERYGLWGSVSVWTVLWVLYLSFVNVGQVFYGFGWESILLEAGFYTIFLGPANVPPPKIMIWILRWLLFRIMFGAGLIKLRGDPCWRDFTCLDYHYETQPMPNPLSWYFHWGPAWTHHAGVAFNHLAELIAPFGYFVTGIMATVAGFVTLLFQGLIMASGNLSWLNFLTIILTIPTFEDKWLAAVLPLHPPAFISPSASLQMASYGIAILVGLLSIRPIGNMLSPDQVMNTNYNPLHLVGTYGAFGSITRTRYEIVVEGTEESTLTSSTVWREYEFKGKPGDPSRHPPQIAPYHLRLDWLLWFAAMSGYQQHPWFVPFMIKLLQGDPDILSLLKANPFPEKPPHFIRAELYEYHFTTPDERKKTGRWWKRQWAGDYFPAVSLENRN